MSISERPRFELLTPDEMNELFESRRSDSTNRVIKSAEATFREFVSAKGVNLADLANSNTSLDSIVKEFFLTVKRQDGEGYKSKTLHSLKYGVKHFILKELGKDIGDEGTFSQTCEAFKVAIHQAKKDGRGSINHKPVMTDGDRQKLRQYQQDHSSPVKLQQKVFTDIMFHFCRRGRENLREISTDWFEFKNDENGVEYVTMRDELDKNHRGCDNEGQQARMYATNTPDCPVKSLKLYISLLNKSAKCFFQRPKMIFTSADSCWYNAAPVGKNIIGNMMQKISKEAGLSKIYTNHSIRATVITTLDHAGFEARHIQQISGHKTAASLQHYAQVVSEDQLRNISNTIGVFGQHQRQAAAHEERVGAGTAQTFNQCTFNFNMS